MTSPHLVIASEARQSPSREIETLAPHTSADVASARKPRLAMTQRMALASIAILAAIIFISYHSALQLNFYGDDYSFLELAGRSSFAQYLASYFDPRLQTGWYRPMQGMLFGIEWVLFGGNPAGYHLVNALVHLANCLLLFALVGVVSQKWRVAFLSALLYAGLPLYGVAVFWPGDADFLLTFFYLSSILFWVSYLQRSEHRLFVLSFVCFLLALMTKEFGVTLPIILFLADRLLLQRSPARNLEIASPRSFDSAAKSAAPLRTLFATALLTLLRRYIPFLIVYLLYLPLEYYIQSRGVLTNTYGYSVANHVVSNFVQYLAALAFPWNLPEPLNYIWLVVAISIYGFITLTKQSAPLFFLGLGAILAFLPVTPFPWFFTRYLYLAVMATAIILARLFDLVVMRCRRARWCAAGAAIVITLIVLGNSIGVAGTVADFAELGRQTRVPFRDISQRHASFPDDTYLYFINPPTITSQLSGMFFLRYGGGVHVASDADGNRRADLRAHANAYVIYFDEQRRTREVAVDKALSVETRPALPVNFAAPIRLEDYELASANVKRDQAIVLLLYWRALKPIENDYAVAAQLVDAHGTILADYGNQPKRDAAPTSTWEPGTLIVDAIVLPIDSSMPTGENLSVRIGLYFSPTGQRLSILNSRDEPVDDTVVLDRFAIVP